MRRTAVRQITNFEFGHPHMGSGFGGVFVNKPNSEHIVDSGVQRTVLDNGVQIVTHDKGGAASTVGFFADAGVKYDPASAPGLTHVARHGLLSSNMHNALFQIDRAYRAVGSAYGHTEVNKRWVGAWALGNRATWRVAVDQMAPAFAAPRFVESDLERWRDNLDAQREETRWNFPRTFAVDELESVAFYKEPLGNPRMVRPETNDKSSTKALLEKYSTYMTPSRVVVVGVNVPHQELLASYSTQAFQHSAKAPHHERAQPALEAGDESKQYYGGKSLYEYENRGSAMGTKPDMDQEGIVALGWLTAGADETPVKYAAALVYHQMLAIAASEALYDTTKTQLSHGIQSFFRPYSTAGLVGYTIRGAPETLRADLEKCVKLLPSDYVANLGAAKARAVAHFFASNVECETDYAAFLGTSKWSAEEVIGAINAATVNTVAEVADRVRASKPVLYATGDVMHLPTLRQLGI